MEKVTIAMSSKELCRLHRMQRLGERGATQAQAAQALGLTVRQVQRMREAYVSRGAGGLVSGRRGKRSNRATPEAIRDYVVGIVRERYSDFGPTLAREKLMEVHGVSPGRETLREWMTEAGLWQTRMGRRKRAPASSERSAGADPRSPDGVCR